MKLSRRFWSLHVPQPSIFLLATNDLGGRGPSHNFFNASPSTASPKNEIPPPKQQIPQLVQCKSINYNCKSHNCKSLHAPQLSFFVYQPMICEVGVGQRRRGLMLSIQSKNQIKTHFELVPSWHVVWLDHSAETFFYQPKTWMMNLSKRFWSLHVPHPSFFLLSTKDLRGRGKSHNLLNANPSIASPKNEILPQEQQIPHLVQCKPNNCQTNPNRESLFVLHWLISHRTNTMTSHDQETRKDGSLPPSLIMGNLE